MIALLIVGIAFISPWGKIFQFDAFSVNAILGFALFGFGVATGRVYYGFKIYHYLFFLFLFNLLATLATLYHHGFDVELNRAIKFFYYAVVTLICTSTAMDDRRLDRILVVYFNSSVVMCLFSLADYYNFVNIPGFNEWMNELLIQSYEDGKGVSGPFDTRTGIASYLSLTFPIGVYCFFTRTGLARIFYGAGALVVVLTGLLSLSRGLYPAMAVVFLIYALKAFQNKGLSKTMVYWRTLLLFSLFVLGSYYLIRASSQQMHSSFMTRVSSLEIEKVAASDADMLRVWTFQKTIEDLWESPLGMGYSSVVLWTGEEKNTHNIFTLILRVAGFLGLVFFATFIIPYFRKVWGKSDDPILSCLNAIFISFFIYGMTHNILGTLLFWIFLGLAINKVFHPRYGRSKLALWKSRIKIVWRRPIANYPGAGPGRPGAPVFRTPGSSGSS